MCDHGVEVRNTFLLICTNEFRDVYEEIGICDHDVEDRSTSLLICTNQFQDLLHHQL